MPYKTGPKPPKSLPASWQDATLETINRIQHIFQMYPVRMVPFQTASGATRYRTEGLSDHSKILLYQLAHESVKAQGRINSATEYWNTFVNVLRTLVVGMTRANAEHSFD